MAPYIDKIASAHNGTFWRSLNPTRDSRGVQNGLYSYLPVSKSRREVACKYSLSTGDLFSTEPTCCRSLKESELNRIDILRFLVPLDLLFEGDGDKWVCRACSGEIRSPQGRDGSRCAPQVHTSSFQPLKLSAA